MMSHSLLTERLKKGLEETKVEYVNLGKSGLKVSVPILGCMSYGHKDWLPWVLSDSQVTTPISFVRVLLTQLLNVFRRTIS